ncbi:uncharacterized protein B0J16DRAFT_362618 [Fusarium flagelliforme]|uniref:uncharacterized protein n=1 Tax=Fusarium flagelliforme TaxID=2675880 RepID=UPI001E8E1771|nr:uncharacterized protein B0J16DRAFT_362618 [Fusarium flagelliforme]KAH7185043.1 hypothetical protein B0J16DRAFT_362618 [Fusarium flagelliforme]
MARFNSQRMRISRPSPAQHLSKAAPNKPSPQNKRLQYIIEIKDFVPLAESISNYKNPSLAIPQAFFSTLNRVISVRNGFSKHLFRHNEKPGVKSDARHSYFVGILEKVREILKPFSDSATSTSTDTVDRLTNQSNALEVYEPSEDFLNAPDIQRFEPTKKGEAIYEVDPSESLDEALIAFCMMCKDLAEVRKYISNLWLELVAPENGGPKLDPGVLAVVTNTAVEFGRSIAEDALPAFQKHGGTTAMGREYMLRTTAWEAGSDFNPYLKDASTGHGFHDALSHCFPLTETTLLTLALVPWRVNTSIYPEGSFGVCELEIPWKSKTAEQKMIDHGVITTELWFETLALVHHVPDYPCTDEFIRGVKEFKETEKIPFSLIFAAQVDVDIHQVVGSYTERGLNTLLNRIHSMNQDLKSHTNFQQGIRGPHWSPRDEKWLKATQEGFDWFLDGPLHKAKTIVVNNSHNRQEVSIHLERTKKWRILRRSPVIAGLALYYHRAEMHEAGLIVTNAWGSLILPGLLYCALRATQFAKIGWLDMSQLCAMFGEEQFVRFMLQLGVSAVAINEILLCAESEDKDEGKGKGKRTVPLVDQESRISPVGVLSSLVMAMQGEVPEFAFGRISRQPYGSDFTLKEWELPFMVGHILPLAEDGPINMLQTAGKVLD